MVRVHHLLLFSSLLGCTGNTSDDTSDGNTSDSLTEAYAVGVRVINPDSRQLYVSVQEDVLNGNVALSDGREFDGFSRLYAHDGFIFVLDSEVGQAIKFQVGADLSLSEVGRISFQNFGITRFSTTSIFLETDRAFYIDTASAQFIVWNPDEMVIVGSVAIDLDLEREGLGLPSGAFPERAGDYVIMGVNWTDLIAGAAEFVTAALVFDAVTGEALSLTESPQCVNSNGVAIDAAGNAHVLGDNSGGLFEVFLGPGILPPPCKMIIPAGQTTFDPDSYVDMAALTGSDQLNRLRGGGSGYAVTRVLIDGTLPEDADPFTWSSTRAWTHAQLDLATNDVTVDADTPLTVGSGFGPVPGEGGFYLFNYNPEETSSELRYWEHGAPASTPGITLEGELAFLERIR